MREKRLSQRVHVDKFEEFAKHVGRRHAMADAGTFSFCPNKNMTTGEEGMLVTNDDELAERARLLKNQGQDARYHHIVLGHDCKLADIQTALGRSHLKRLGEVVEKKREAAETH